MLLTLIIGGALIPLVWFVTGADDAAVARAANALDESKLHDAFAVAATPTGVVRLPIGAGAP